MSLSGAGWLVVVAVIASAIAVFFYGRVIVIMFFTEPQADGPTVVIPSSFTAIAIAAGLALTIVLGIIPSRSLIWLKRHRSSFASWSKTYWSSGERSQQLRPR